MNRPLQTLRITFFIAVGSLALLGTHTPSCCGVECGVDSECDGGEICIDGFCSEPCTEDADCASMGADYTCQIDEDGRGVCVVEGEAPSCESYCATISANCTGASEQYGSEADCLTACNGNFLHWAELGTIADTSGHSLGCREYHAGAAANDDHCEHAGPTGGGACGDLCEVYCHAMTTYCAASYTDYAACETACSAFATNGAVNDATGNNVQCRIFHAGVAYDDASHCDHADADSAAGTCQ